MRPGVLLKELDYLHVAARGRNCEIRRLFVVVTCRHSRCGQIPRYHASRHCHSSGLNVTAASYCRPVVVLFPVVDRCAPLGIPPPERTFSSAELIEASILAVAIKIRLLQTAKSPEWILADRAALGDTVALIALQCIAIDAIGPKSASTDASLGE